MTAIPDGKGIPQHKFVGIDNRNKVSIFDVLHDRLYTKFQFDSELSDPAKSIAVTHDGKFIIIISQTEFVIYSTDPLRLITKEFSDQRSNVAQYWSHLMVLDQPFDVKKLWESQSAISLSNLIQSDYLRSSGNIPLPPDFYNDELDPNTFSAMEDPSISSLSRLFASKSQRKSNNKINNNNNRPQTMQLMTPSRDDEDDSNDHHTMSHFNHSAKKGHGRNNFSNGGSSNNISFARATHTNTDNIDIPPFFILLWENGAPSINLYLVSSQTPSVLTLAAKLGVYHNGRSESSRRSTPFQVFILFVFSFVQITFFFFCFVLLGDKKVV